MASYSKDPDTGMPNWVPESKANNVSLVTTSEAQDANNIAIGIVTPGWTYYSEHVRADGHIARRKDVIVSFRHVDDPEVPEVPEDPENP